MATFTYKARQRTGEIKTGTLDVADRSAALTAIERMGLFPVSVESAGGGGGGAAGGGGARSLIPASVRTVFTQKRKPKMEEMGVYMRQMANLLKSGMPLTLALNSMSHLESKGIPASVSTMLKQEVMEGRSLSGAMAKQPHIFSNMAVNMVQAGEQSGALEGVLRRLSEHYERFAEVQSRFISAMIYRALVLSVGVVIIIVFMTYMLPKFLEMFAGFDVELPGATKFLVAISDLFTGYWWLGGAIGLSCFIVYRRYQSTERGRQVVDRFKLNMPVIGKVFRLNIFGQFARTLGTLLQNGVPVLTALKITESIMPNSVIKAALAKTREDVTDGKTIAEPLAKAQVFPQLMIDLLKIGEETGDVPGALNNLAETYENDLTVALRVMTNLIEPVMIITIAIFVGFLMYSVLSAMFAITRSVA